MAFTRFNYDDCRTNKLLQESTGPGRWMLDVPGNGIAPLFIDDPHIRMQKWGNNLSLPTHSQETKNVIDIEDELKGRQRKSNPYCKSSNYPFSEKVLIKTPRYKSYKNQFTSETRTTHPAWMYVDLEQTRWEYPLLNPQENVCYPFHSNLSTRIIEKNNFIPKKPCV